MDDNLRDGDSESEVDLADLEVGPSASRLHNLPSSSRQMRNEAEKKRRDTLNGYINELGRLVPMVDGTPRRVDKISILRLAATYLMQNQILYSSSTRQPQFFPEYLDRYNLSQQMIEDMDAFMIVVTAAGKIVFVSHTVEKLLGHTQIDMFGQSLFNFTLKEDHAVLSFNLRSDSDPEDCPPPAAVAPYEDSPGGGGGDDTSSSTSSSDMSAASPAPLVPATPAEPVPVDLQKRSFFIQMSQRSVSRTELPEYKRVHVLGNLRIPRITPGVTRSRSKRQRTECAAAGEGMGPGMETVLIAMVKLEHRIRELSLLEANKEEYVTRHLIDGRIVYSDHRISLVAGYFSEDVSGMSAFKFMHPEDVMFVIVALRQMYDRGEGFGCSCYRLQCANGNFIYLRTHGFLEKNEDTNEVQSFICINTLVGWEVGQRLISEMKTRYSATIETSGNSSATIEEIEDDPKKLDKVISQLIPMSTVDPPTRDTPFPDSQYMKAALTSKSLPPIQAAKQAMGSPSRQAAERPSVITSSVRRRRRDSANETASKRRRPDEALSIQVPCDDLSRVQHASPSYTSPVKGGGGRRSRAQPPPLTSPYKQELSSPPYDERLHSPDQYSGSSVRSRSYPPSYPGDSLPSPSGYVYASPTDVTQQPTYSETLLNNPLEYPIEEPSRVLYNNVEECLSPEQLNYDLKQEILSPADRNYWNQPPGNGEGSEYQLADLLNQSTNVAGDGSDYHLGVMEVIADQSTNEMVVECSDRFDDFMYKMTHRGGEVARFHILSPMLSEPPGERGGIGSEFQLAEVLSQATSDPEPPFSHLESNLQITKEAISMIQQDIKQVPQPPALPLCNNLTMIMEEHKQHEIQLKGLRQEHKTLCEQNLNSP